MHRFLLLSIFGLLTIGANGMPAANTAGPEKVKALIKDLDSQDDNVRLKAVMDLGELGPEARAATAALIGVMKTGNEEVRLNVSVTLGRIGKDAVAPVVRLVNDKDAGLRFYAVWTLGLIGPDARSATGIIVDALKDKEADVRRKAAYALNRIDPKLEAAAPGLVVALGDPNADVGAEAAQAVKRFGAKVVPYLVDGIRVHAAVRAPGLAVLNQLSADSEIVVAAFVPLLREKETQLQMIAGNVLIGHGKAALPKLLVLLQDDDQGVRLEALRLLTIIPADGAVMLPQLKKLLASKSPSLRESAVVVLARLGGDGVPLVVGRLRDPDAGVRWTAAHSLGEMGSTARSAIAALDVAAEDIDADVRAAAKDALRKIGK